MVLGNVHPTLLIFSEKSVTNDEQALTVKLVSSNTLVWGWIGTLL